MLAFFAIFPPKEVSEKINEIRKKYDKNYLRLAPHVTIIPPFTPKKDMKLGIEQLEKILKVLHPFEIEIFGVGNFRKKISNVCYLDIIDTLDLIELQTVTNDILLEFGTRERYPSDFHITIARRLNNHTLKKITAEIEKLSFKDSFLVKYLAYCVIEKNEPWQIKELIPIGAIKNARNNPK